MSSLSNRKVINEVINESNQNLYVLESFYSIVHLEYLFPVVNVNFHSNKQEQELINFSYQTVTE